MKFAFKALAVSALVLSSTFGVLPTNAADTKPPNITCGEDKSVEAGDDWAFDIPTAADEIDGFNLVIEVVSTVTNVLSPRCPALFSVTRTWRVTDTSSNSAFCNQTVTVLDTQPPDIQCGPDKHVECGAFWAFDIPTAVDEHDLNNVLIEVVATVTNVAVPRCPQIFSVTRTWRATDTCGNSAFCNQTVTVIDLEPPELTCHEDKFASPGSNWMFDNPMAADICDLNNVLIEVVATVTNSLPPGGPALFSVTRIWRATDTCGNSAFCNQTVTVVIVPVIDCPANIIRQSTGPLTPVTYNVTAADANGAVPVTCVPPSGTGFRVGTSNVVCSASNSNGTSTCSFTVTVFKPNQCPVASNLTVTATAGSSANFQLPASDADGDPLHYFVTQPPQHGVVVVNIQTGAASYSPSQGYCGPDSFKFKANDGVCDSSDATVTIDVPCGLRPQKRQLLADLIALRAGATDHSDQDHLDDAIDHIQDSLADSLWFDDNHLISKKGKKVFDEEEDACEKLNDILEDIEDDDSDLSAATIKGFIDRLVAIDRALAVISVDEAEAGGANPKKIKEDREEIEDGDKDAAKGKCDKAIKHYRDAWAHAVKLKAGGHLIVQHSVLGFRLHFAGIAGEQYVLQVSSDFVHWSDLASITADAEGDIEYTDAQAVGQPSRFYRVLQP